MNAHHADQVNSTQMKDKFSKIHAEPVQKGRLVLKERVSASYANQEVIVLVKVKINVLFVEQAHLILKKEVIQKTLANLVLLVNMDLLKEQFLVFFVPLALLIQSKANLNACLVERVNIVLKKEDPMKMTANHVQRKSMAQKKSQLAVYLVNQAPIALLKVKKNALLAKKEDIIQIQHRILAECVHQEGTIPKKELLSVCPVNPVAIILKRNNLNVYYVARESSILEKEKIRKKLVYCVSQVLTMQKLEQVFVFLVSQELIIPKKNRQSAYFVKWGNIIRMKGKLQRVIAYLVQQVNTAMKKE